MRSALLSFVLCTAAAVVVFATTSGEETPSGPPRGDRPEPVAEAPIVSAAPHGGDQVTGPKRYPVEAQESDSATGGGNEVATTARPELTVDPTELIAIHVRDEFGNPICGARAKHWCGAALTDRNGFVRVPWRFSGAGHSSPTQQFACNKIVISAEGHVPVEVSPIWGLLDTVWLRRGLRLAGRCVDSSGRPLAGFRLVDRRALTGRSLERFNETRPVVVTDGTGRFMTREAPAHPVELVAGDYAWITRVNRVIPPAKNLRIVAYRPARVSGRVVDATGREQSKYWPFGRLVVSPTGGRRILLREGGRFEVECVPGPIVIRWSGSVVARLHLAEGEHRSGIRLAVPGRPRPPAHRTRPVESRERGSGHVGPARSSRGACLRGSLVRKAGRKLSHGRLSLRPVGERSAVRHVIDRVRFDSLPPFCFFVGTEGCDFRGGRFTISSVKPGAYDLVWETAHQGSLVLLRRGIRMPDPPRDLDLGALVVAVAPTAVRVRVISSAGRPLVGTVVRLLDRHRIHAVARTNPHGVAGFSVLVPDGLVIEVVDRAGRVIRRKLAVPDTSGGTCHQTIRITEAVSR